MTCKGRNSKTHEWDPAAFLYNRPLKCLKCGLDPDKEIKKEQERNEIKR